MHALACSCYSSSCCLNFPAMMDMAWNCELKVASVRVCYYSNRKWNKDILLKLWVLIEVLGSVFSYHILTELVHVPLFSAFLVLIITKRSYENCCLPLSAKTLTISSLWAHYLKGLLGLVKCLWGLGLSQVSDAYVLVYNSEFWHELWSLQAHVINTCSCSRCYIWWFWSL